jgi:selT/selW/selH-like putative selenoprotein
LQNAIKDKYGIESRLIEGSGGAFEVRIDGTLVFSKLKQFRFPEEDEIFAAIDRARQNLRKSCLTFPSATLE